MDGGRGAFRRARRIAVLRRGQSAHSKISPPDRDTMAGSSHRGKFIAYFRVSTDKQGNRASA
jgi:hypothetical protein